MAILRGEAARLRIVWLEHVLEHIKVDRVPRLLREILQVLAPGGILRVISPDLKIRVVEQSWRQSLIEDPEDILDSVEGREENFCLDAVK
ncbi:MAG: methyltransferase domain-containing protein [bacterium]